MIGSVYGITLEPRKLADIDRAMSSLMKQKTRSKQTEIQTLNVEARSFFQCATTSGEHQSLQMAASRSEMVAPATAMLIGFV